MFIPVAAWIDDPKGYSQHGHVAGAKKHLYAIFVLEIESIRHFDDALRLPAAFVYLYAEIQRPFEPS